MNLTSNDFPMIMTNNSIVVYHNGKPNTVTKDNPNFTALKDAISEKRWDDIPALLSPESAVDSLSNGRLRVKEGTVYLTDEDGNEFTVSSSLNENILYHIKEKLPLEPLVNFALNLQQNTSSRSVQQLFDWIKNTKMTITPDGCFIAYKGVRNDFKDSNSGTFDNSPGKVCKMPRNQVDDDPTRTCSHGLHVATWDYANKFSERTVSVKVNPADVVAVPVDYNRTKMRVCAYEVLEELERPLEDLVYTPPENTAPHDDDYDDYDDDDEYF